MNENLKHRHPIVRWGAQTLTEKEKKELERLSIQANQKLDGCIDISNECNMITIS